MRGLYMRMAAMIGISAICGWAMAADAATSAGVTGRNGQPGTATATAHYAGEAGYARTTSRSGTITQARGIAVGVDQNGLALSLSNAVEHRGLAVATNFNLSIGRDGEVSTSNGVAIGRGGQEREVMAGGAAGAGRPAVSQASARTEHGGSAQAFTRAQQLRPYAERVLIRRIRSR